MIRKSIGPALLAIAVVAFVLAWVMPATTSAYDPFSPIPYYPYAYLAVTGNGAVQSGISSFPTWLIPMLLTLGGVAVACGLSQLLWRRRQSSVSRKAPCK